MAVEYRYENIKEALNGDVTVTVIVFDPVGPMEQTFLTLEFASGVTVNDIETKVNTYANIVANLARN